MPMECIETGRVRLLHRDREGSPTDVWVGGTSLSRYETSRPGGLSYRGGHRNQEGSPTALDGDFLDLIRNYRGHLT